MEIFQGQDPVSQTVLFFNTADIRHKLKTNLSNKAFRFNFLSAYSFRNLWRSFTACAVTPTGRSNEKHLYKKLTLCLPSCMNKNIISKFRNTNLCYSQSFYFDLYNISWFEDLILFFLTGEKYMQNILLSHLCPIWIKSKVTPWYLTSCFRDLAVGSSWKICNKQVWQCSLQKECELLLVFFRAQLIKYDSLWVTKNFYCTHTYDEI